MATAAKPARVFFVRMDSAATGETLAGGHFLGDTPAKARAIAHEAFSQRLTEADVAGMRADLAESILARDEARTELMARGVVFQVRASNVARTQAINFAGLRA